MFKNVTKWLGVVDNTDEEETLAVNAEGEEKVENPTPANSTDQVKDTESNNKKAVNEQENDDLISPETKQTLEEVSAKAISTAKEWGSKYTSHLYP